MTSNTKIIEENPDEDWYYLFGLYREVDQHGPFAEKEANFLSEERRQDLLDYKPEYLDMIVASGIKMLHFARNGDLLSFHEQLMEMRMGELSVLMVMTMFEVALLAGNLHIAEYMRRKGLPMRNPVSERILWGLVERSGVFSPANKNKREINFPAISSDDDFRDTSNWMNKIDPLDIPIHPSGINSSEIRTYYMDQLQQRDKKLTTFFNTCFEDDFDLDESNRVRFPVTPVVSLQWLLKYFPQVNIAHPQSGETLLHISAADNNPEVVSLLLSLGADPNAIDNSSMTPAGLCMRDSACLSIIKNAGGMDDWKAALKTLRPKEESFLEALQRQMKLEDDMDRTSTAHAVDNADRRNNLATLSGGVGDGSIV